MKQTSIRNHKIQSTEWDGVDTKTHLSPSSPPNWFLTKPQIWQDAHALESKVDLEREGGRSFYQVEKAEKKINKDGYKYNYM